MKTRVELENIEAMRLEAGIHDVGLQEDVRRLRAGDVVRLTARDRNRQPPGESLLVRVTSVAGGALRGRLTHAARASQLAAGTLLTFAAAHVHSVVSRGEAGRSSGTSAGRLALVVTRAVRYTFAKREIG